MLQWRWYRLLLLGYFVGIVVHVVSSWYSIGILGSGRTGTVALGEHNVIRHGGLLHLSAYVVWI